MKIVDSSRLALLVAASLVVAPRVPAQLGVASVSGSDDQPASAALIAASATGTIQACAFEARNQLLFDIESRLKQAEKPLDKLSTKARALPEPAQEKCETAMEQVKTQQAALKIGMDAAAKANAKTWPQIRATLAFSYADYVGAIVRLENLVIQ